VGKQFSKLEAAHRDFIARQRIFFTATAAETGRINVSPRGTDAFRTLSDSAAVYLDRTGSGNESAAHLRRDGRMTIMFCALEGPPMILRLYGRGRIIPRGQAEYAALLADTFEGKEPTAARQMVRLDFDLVQGSCGYGVPLFDYTGERSSLDNWAASKGEEGLAAYRREKNVTSIDGFVTGFAEDRLA